MMTSEVLTVYQQLVFTAFRYPKLRQINNGPKKDIPPPPGLEPQATGFSGEHHTWCSSRRDGYLFLYLYNIIIWIFSTTE